MRSSLRAASAALALSVLALLGACAESPTAPTSGPGGTAVGARPAATMPIAAARTVRGCEGVTIALSADETRLLDLHNETRRALGLAEFCADPTLTTAARAHSREMLEQGYFAHASFDGASFDVRIRALGFPARRALAENVAWGTGRMGEPDDVFDRFLASEEHRRNIVDPTLRRIGVGVAAGTYLGRDDARLYTVDFSTL
jgi:uncharacterized protein YkwD